MPGVLRATVAVVTAAGLVGLGAMAYAAAVASTVIEPATASAFHAYRQQGPSADYSGDVGSIGLMRPARVALAARSDVVVSFSFGYRASQDPFAASLRVQGPGDRTRDATPDARRVRPAAHRDSTTLQYLVTDLPPGTYRFSIEVNVDGRWRSPARITTGEVLISGTVTPSPL
jgi:hypothetical protein